VAGGTSDRLVVCVGGQGSATLGTVPDPSSPLRRVAGSAIALLLVAGCQTLDEAGQVVDRSDLVSDLATLLTQASGLTYSADYQLPRGQRASIAQAQQPLRAAYSYPGGKLTVTADAVTECDLSPARATCILHAPPAPGQRPAPEAFADASARGLVAPTAVVDLLTSAAVDAEALVEQYDTTLAGRHASCVRVSQLANATASRFDTCVTTEGALGSFRGTVDGRPVDLALSRYRDTVDATAFDPPLGAGVVDRRSAMG
jgi:hypothetical protein